VKHDTCSPGFCGVYGDEGRDGTGDDGNCIRRSTTLMSEALQASGRDIVYYIDHGNPTSPQKVFNPFLHHVPTEKAGAHPGTDDWNVAVGWNSLALKPAQLGWTWGASVSHRAHILSYSKGLARSLVIARNLLAFPTGSEGAQPAGRRSRT
jgi:hypothetical protein